MADQDIKDIWFSAIGRASNYQTMVFHAGTGQDTFEFNFSGGYINKDDIKAFMVEETTRERIDLTLTFTNTNTVKTNRVVPKNWTICIYRDTPKSMPLAKFVDGAIINATNLDRNAKQAVFAVSEMVDRFDSTVEQVDTALVKVAEALVASAEAVKTANAADKKADTAITTANGAVTTANSASSKADTAIKTANAATTTANGAVVTANAAKATADGLNAQIIQANATADKALTTANGIDAKATKALADAAAAVKTANEAKTTANAIDAKATQAQKDAADALAAVDVAKGLTDRVDTLGGQGTNSVSWKAPHRFPGYIRIAKTGTTGSAATNYEDINAFETEDGAGTRFAMYTRRPDGPSDYWFDHTHSPTINLARMNADLDVNKQMVVSGAVTHRTNTTLNTVTVNGTAVFGSTVEAAGTIFTKSSQMGFDHNGRRHLYFRAGAGASDGVIYKDVKGPFVLLHQGDSGAGSLTLEGKGTVTLQGTDPNITGVGNLEFASRSGTKNAHWLRQSGDASADNFIFGLAGIQMLNLQYRVNGGNIAIFQNEIYSNGTTSSESFITHGGARFYSDGGITGPSWANSGWNDAVSAVNWCRSQANDAWNKANEGQMGRMTSIRRGGQQYYQTAAQGSWEAPTGCFLTGRNSAVGDGRAMGFYFRGLQRHIPANGWIDCDGDAG